MSRSGYSDVCENNWAGIRYRGAVKSALRGARGQAFLAEMITALDALPKQELVAHELQTTSGEFCALGAVGALRGLDMSTLDPEDIETVSGSFGISDALAREIVWMNDEYVYLELSQDRGNIVNRRWSNMRQWCVRNLITRDAMGDR